MPTLTEILDRNTIEYYDCVKFDFGLGNYTNAPWNLTIGSDTYISAGGMLGVGPIEASSIFDIDSLDFLLAGLVPIDGLAGTGTPIVKQIQALSYIDQPVTVTRAYVKAGVTEQTIIMYKGFVNAVSASVSNTGSTTVNVKTSSHWANFQRVNSRYTNIKSQQAYYPDDIGFKYAKAVQKEIVWAQPA